MARRSRGQGSSRKSRGRGKVAKVMGEYKRRKLRSSSGGKVRKRKQAVAIALSEARRSGARIPRKGRSRRGSRSR
ncbi:MAG TPA: DUF6496 domain-containing protein [Methylomirabilota bacterium]|nr:DUF6496 domain-containing protein [Methylomirabilota bacterium]